MQPPGGSEAMAVASDARRAVFLDRDGVLIRSIVRNGRPYSASAVAEAELLPGVGEACLALRRAGAVLIAVTNQPEIRRGTLDPEVLAAIHEWLRAEIGLDDVRVCPHDDRDLCDCRKPKPGLLTAAARDWGVDLRRSVMVGDRWRDIEAGKEAGCTTVFVDRQYDERCPQAPDVRVSDLPAAVPWILSHLNGGGASNDGN